MTHKTSLQGTTMGPKQTYKTNKIIQQNSKYQNSKPTEIITKMNTNSKQTSSSKTHNIMQWNCRSIKPNFNELLILISLFNPATICLQETFLKENHNLKTLNYKQYHYIHNTGHRANGGTLILVRNHIPQSQFPIKSKLQAVATQVTLHKTITICSIYIPPHEQINETELKNLIKQLTQPFILLGDFNSHSTL